ncbi:hypothetical protein E4U15_006040 [Claviceps sp. LM218 group G6]|nr:hypothetical protein E4U15_006040 [Claviceps sp. LM218 group G6]
MIFKQSRQRPRHHPPSQSQHHKTGVCPPRVFNRRAFGEFSTPLSSLGSDLTCPHYATLTTIGLEDPDEYNKRPPYWTNRLPTTSHPFTICRDGSDPGSSTELGVPRPSLRHPSRQGPGTATSLSTTSDSTTNLLSSSAHCGRRKPNIIYPTAAISRPRYGSIKDQMWGPRSPER